MAKKTATVMGLAVRAIGTAALGAFVIWLVGLTAGHSYERQWRIAIGVGLIAASPSIVRLLLLLLGRPRNPS